jgi:hypothetical protein
VDEGENECDDDEEQEIGALLAGAAEHSERS